MTRPTHRARRIDAGQVLGARIVAFAASRQGTPVGDGECFTLVQQALLAAGARSAETFGEITPDADYVWGTPVPLSAVRPGDVLQFRDFRIIRRVTTMLRYPDGEVSQSESEDSEERDHHSAIVAQPNGSALTILEQNVDPDGRVVQLHRLETANRVYTQTNPADGSVVTTDIRVQGNVWAYRPQKASAAQMAAVPAASGGNGNSTSR